MWQISKYVQRCLERIQNGVLKSLNEKWHSASRCPKLILEFYGIICDKYVNELHLQMKISRITVRTLYKGKSESIVIMFPFLIRSIY